MFKTIREADTKDKKVILRADLDVPVEDGKIGEDYRLKALLPTLKLLADNNAKVLIIGHLGRPGGKKDISLSLRPVAQYLEELLGKKVSFFEEHKKVTFNDQLSMLENLRFWPGEERGDKVFAKELAGLGNIYINEAFAASHRTHTSVAGIPKYLPAFAGLRLEDEVLHLSGVIENPERPLVFILGGAKTETKAPLVADLAKVADKILLGGLLMFRQDLEGIEGVVFPVDAADAYDIGPKAIELFTAEVAKAKTIVWNGPLGRWEDRRYELATRRIAEALVEHPGKTIIGGGDTIAALSAFNLLKEMGYVSIGGGAMLEFLAGKILPGLKALGYYG